jgi:hypothetical protein
MAEQRKTWTKRPAAAKAKAVGIALLEGVTEAERQTGIPKESIHYWLDRPEFAHLRTRAREDMATDVKAAFLRALARTVELLDTETDLRAVGDVADKLGNRYALLSGEATARTEHRDIDDVDDRDAVSAAADAYVASVRARAARMGGQVRAGAAPAGDAALLALPVPGVDPEGRLT